MELQDHVLFDLQGEISGPLLIVMAGVHGNEPAGRQALEEIHQWMKNEGLKLHGRFVGLLGNTAALAQGKRYLEKDLNRMWTKERVYTMANLPIDLVGTVEDKEQHQLIHIIQALLWEDYTEFLFMDLHTTSAYGGYFCIANDHENSLAYALELQVPVISSITKVLEGTTLQYFKDIGLPAIGLEAGQHNDPIAVQNMRAAIKTILLDMNMVDPTKVDKMEEEMSQLRNFGLNLPKNVTFLYRHSIKPEDNFVMQPGYHNFQRVILGEHLADDRKGAVLCPMDGYMLMPLYQAIGEDGFFIVGEL
jgi:succinylglutamate desuccinylase